MKIKNILICLLLEISIIPNACAMEDPNPSQISEIAKRNTQALFDAIENGDKHKVERLLKEEHIDINAYEQTSEGRTPLIRATMCKPGKQQLYLEIIKILLNIGADVNKISRDTMSPLIWVALRYQLDIKPELEIAIIFLQGNADINIRAYNGMTPLMIAAGRPCSIKMVKLFLKFGANPNIQDKNGETALDYAQLFKNPEVIALLTAAQEKRKTDSVVALLLREWHDKESIWHNLDQFLIEKILKHVKHIRNNEALLKAVKSGNNYWIEQLLKEPNIDVNIKYENGNTALHLAIMQNKPHLLSLAKMLLEAGADREIQNNNEQTALDLAGIFNNDRVKNLLKDEEDTCDICCISIDDKEEGFEPSCGHNAFHSACIEQWKNSGPNKTCPICRGSLPKKSS